MGGIRKCIFCVGFLFSNFAFANSLPLISLEQLKVGKFWIWTYYTEGDLNRTYSAERYEVISVAGTFVTFEVRSRYDDFSKFRPRMRFRVDYKKCEKAFQNPELKVNFSIDLYPYEKGRWSRMGIPTDATAFEEKFNCNPITHSEKNSLYETRFDSVMREGKPVILFQQWPKFPQSQIRSFYYLNRPGLEGVAYRKEFNPGTASDYEMRLTKWAEWVDSAKSDGER